MASVRQKLEHGFGPLYRPDSKVLILGSFPSVKSREAAFYYGHPQNRFWAVLAALCGEELPHSRAEKERLLEAHGVALYDVIESWTIVGSSDSSIEDVQVTDLLPILQDAQIEGRIYTNGAKAHQLYMKYSYPKLGLPAVKLPSTSPANAAFSLDRLVRDWGALLPPIREKGDAK